MVLFYLVIIIAVAFLISRILPDVDPNRQEDARSRYYGSSYGSRSGRTYQN